jgi:hypothetical protein
MNEPTPTLKMRALIEQVGVTSFAFTVLRQYWKPVSATAGAILALGTIIQQGRDAKTTLETIQATQLAQGERLTRLEAEWGALFGAAHINVVPNEPQPSIPTPSEARKGKVKR